MASYDFVSETEAMRKMTLKNEMGSERNRYFALPLTKDKKTEMYVKFAKVLIIFQGPDLDERTRAVNNVISTYKHSCFVISDETYRKDTQNKFDPDHTEEFYNYFKDKTKKAFETGYNLIAIDQSINTVEQIRYYFYFAQQMQYVVLVVPPLVEDEGSNYHHQGKKNFNQAESFYSIGVTIKFPNLFKHFFCGWYLHDVDSAELRDLADLYLQDCFENIHEFRKLFSKVCNGENFKDYYNMLDRRQNLACCIVKVFRSIMSAVGYFKKDSVMKFYGKMSKLYIVGFIVSPHVVAARVKLTHEQKDAWELPDDISEQSEIDLFPSELQKLAKIALDGIKISLICSKSNRTVITGKSISEPTEVISLNSKARSCHIVLGKTKGASSQNVDYDVPFAVHRQRYILKKATDNEIHTEDIGRALVQRIGKYWFIYLKESIIVDGFFATGSKVETYDNLSI